MGTRIYRKNIAGAGAAIDSVVLPHSDLVARTVYVLTYVHRHGQDVSVYATNEGAAHALAEICRLYWEAEVDPGREGAGQYPATAEGLDDPSVIGAYFHYQADFAGDPETWEIDEATVQP